MPQPTLDPPSCYINVSTSDLESAIRFFTALDFEQNMYWKTPVPDMALLRFPGTNCNICLVILKKEAFTGFIRPESEIVNSNRSTEMILSVTRDTKEAVDAMVDKAVAAGGKADPFEMPNHGAAWGVYSRSFEDLDGHLWEVMADLEGHSLWGATAFSDKMQGEHSAQEL